MLHHQPNETEEVRRRTATKPRADDVQARIVDRGGRPVVSIEQVSTRPDGKIVRRRVEIDAERFAGLSDVVRARLDHGGWREAEMPRPDVARDRSAVRGGTDRRETKADLEPGRAKEYWPVVSVHKTLSTGAIVSVDRTFTSRRAAEKHAFRSSGRAALAVPMPAPYNQGEKLVVAETEASPKLASLIRYHREYEREYGDRLERLAEQGRVAEERRWTGSETFGDKARAHAAGELVWSRTAGGTRAQVFSKIDDTGERRRSVVLTWNERGEDGSLKEVSTHHDLRALLEIYRRFRNSERPEREEKRCVMGVWRGAGKPEKDQKVVFEGLDGVGGPLWAAPLGEKASPRVEGARPVYVVCRPTDEQGVYRVLGSTKNLQLAETRLADIERVHAKAQRNRSDWAFERLSNLAAQYDPWDKNLKAFVDRLARRETSQDRKSRDLERQERRADIQPEHDGREQGRGPRH